MLRHNDYVTPVCSVAGQSVGGNRTWYAHELAALQKSAKPAGCHPGIDVDVFWKNNQAIGNVYGCAGYSAMWTFTGGAWHELGTQEILPCVTLRKAGATHVIDGNTGWVCTVPVSGHAPVTVQYNPRG